MPEISRFLGIVISINFDDHPPPHFHVRYGEQRATVNIAPLALQDGELSPRALGLVIEWASQHRPELRENWNRARRHEKLVPIKPLE